MELYIEPVRKTINPTNHQFLPGHTPHNKGKRMVDYMDMRKVEKVLKCLTHTGRPDIGGWNKRQVIGIKNGKLHCFESASHAAKILGIQRRNIASCCAGKRKHCGGIQWFFESDIDKWIVKINS